MKPDPRAAEVLKTLPNRLAEVLTECLNTGMVPPFIVASISPNGGVYVMRYVAAESGLKAEPLVVKVEPLAEHAVEPGLLLPINIMIVDQTGEAARVVINQTGTMTFHALRISSSAGT